MKKTWLTLGIIFVVIAMLVQLMPFYIATTTAIKPKTDLSSRWDMPEDGIYLENFEVAIERGKILTAMKNSAVVTVVSVVFVCFLGSLAAYPLARMKNFASKFITIFILGVMMVPPLSTLVPLLTMMNKLNAVNTYFGIILIMITGQLPLSIFLYKNFIAGIPISLEEAARIDGANYLQIYKNIIFPIMKPVTASVVILAGTFIWNDYQMSLYMLTSSDKRTITTAVGSFFSQNGSNLGAATAAALIGVVPIVVAYIFLQKYFMKGMVDGAVKG